ncbi:MAG: M56 family metallopeptidase [Candidatus Sulfotelmatobacter sp.]
MFVLRAIMVGLAFFGICYSALSLLIIVCWQTIRLFPRTSFVQSSRSLFALRIFPLAVSVFVTLVFAVPAFFWLEGGMDEDLGTLLFSVAAFLILAVGCIRIMAAYFGASRLVREWVAESTVLNSSPCATAFCRSDSTPPLLLYGIFSPRVLVSETAVSLLSPDELRVAIQHELSHLRFRDNLKKLILYGIPFLGTGSLERAWQEATELASDEAAVSSKDEALTLAAALIKLCERVTIQEPPAFTTGLVQPAALVNVRVRRLLTWNGAIVRSAKVRRLWGLIIPASLGYLVFSYGHLLILIHQLTEWFIH